MERDEHRLAAVRCSCETGRGTAAPNRDRGWTAARRAAAASGRAASARAIRTRARSPVDSRLTGRSASLFQLELRDEARRSRLPSGAVEAERDDVARGDRPGDVARGGEEGEQAPAPRRRSGIDILAVDRHRSPDALSIRARARSRLVLPPPLGPTSATSSPAWTSRSVGVRRPAMPTWRARSDVMPSPSAAWSAPATGTAAFRTGR